MKIIETSIYLTNDEVLTLNEFRNRLKSQKDEIFTDYVPYYVRYMLDDRLDDKYRKLSGNNIISLTEFEALNLFVYSEENRETIALVASNILSVNDGKFVKNLLDDIYRMEREVDRFTLSLKSGLYIENKWISSMINSVPLNEVSCHQMLDTIDDETGEIRRIRVIYHADVLQSFIDKITEYLNDNPTCSSKFWIFRHKLIDIMKRVKRIEYKRV